MEMNFVELNQHRGNLKHDREEDWQLVTMKSAEGSSTKMEAFSHTRKSKFNIQNGFLIGSYRRLNFQDIVLPHLVDRWHLEFVHGNPNPSSRQK